MWLIYDQIILKKVHMRLMYIWISDIVHYSTHNRVISWTGFLQLATTRNFQWFPLCMLIFSQNPFSCCISRLTTPQAVLPCGRLTTQIATIFVMPPPWSIRLNIDLLIYFASCNLIFNQNGSQKHQSTKYSYYLV